MPVPGLGDNPGVRGDPEARGQILTSSDGSFFKDQVVATYNGLGQMLTSTLREEVVSQTAGPGGYAATDSVTYDPLGNILYTRHLDSLLVGGGASVTSQSGSNGYDNLGRLTSRPGWDSPTLGTVNLAYDAAGNQTWQYTLGATAVEAERAAYYGADDRLRATDTRSSGRRVFEEYRYDALGRRIWVRHEPACEPTNAIECITGFTRRVVWDGVQELGEIQAPHNASDPNVEEQDGGWATLPYNPAAGSYGDPNPFYGRVAYSPGLVVDQPISMTRYDYRDKPGTTATPLTWPTFTLLVFWNYQGAPAYGLFSDGAWARPYALGPVQTSCPSLGNQTQERCVLLQWPFAHSAYDLNRGNLRYPSWQGSLLAGKLDGSGLEAKRARYYDPQTGRFTQEDPIGIAGGLNAYGFANGDPVNFSDPFGLCPTCFVALYVGLTPAGARAEGSNVVLTSLIGIEQVRSGGTRAWRNNNPGNLRNSTFSTSHGSLGEAGGFAAFGSVGAGERALVSLLSTEIYQSLTLDAAIARYAPATENDTRAYQIFVQRSTGVAGTTPLRDLSEARLRSLVRAIRAIEGWSEGGIRSRRP